jgi:asparagine synthase (glutamine-hydrolysing)
MCGINGIMHWDAQRRASTDQVRRMRDALIHRGPDDNGVWVEGNVGLGHRRLSIIDTSERGRQPMTTANKRYHIVFNGEIYNFQSLRRDLADQGCVFHSDSDTEVLLELFAREGEQMLPRLNGMFAFAVWDSIERRLFVARDRMGVKPLFYAETADGFYFGSEQSALFAAGVAADFDERTWEELLLFRYVAGEQTPHRGLKRLLPGHFLVVEGRSVQTRRWWNLALESQKTSSETGHESQTSFRELVDDAVRLRLISDVPVGVFLSGGLDSSSIAASMANQRGPGVKSFTVRFSEAYYDEGPYARDVAEKWQLQQHELVLRPADYLDSLEEATVFQGEPLAHGNDMHMLALSRKAKSEVTVLLSGEGADETMAGYVRYRPLRYPHLLRALRHMRPLLSRLKAVPRLVKLGDMVGVGDLDDFILFNASNLFPADLAEVGFAAQNAFEYRRRVLADARAFTKDPVKQAMYYDVHCFLGSLLARNDRMTMGAAIECRTPFLDYRLVHRAFARPTSDYFREGEGKWLLRSAMKQRLPTTVLKHKKWGFGVPWAKYLREQRNLRERVSFLADLDPVRGGPFDRLKLRGAIDRFLAGDDRSIFLIQQLLMITVWHERCVAAFKSRAHRAHG